MHKIFGQHFRKERKKQGLTIKKVAKTCGVSHSYISLIENYKRLPGKKNLPKIAGALGLKKEVVFNWYIKDIARKIKKDIKL